MKCNGVLKVTPDERQILQDLAKRQAEIASMPIQAERAKLWKDFNSLNFHRPMVLAYPEGGWCDLINESQLQCQQPLLRKWEMTLRKIIYQHENICDDQPVTIFFNIGWVFQIGDYGLSETITRSAKRGSFTWQGPIKNEKDIDKLHIRSINIDRQETSHLVELAQDIFGDILEIRVHDSLYGGSLWWSCGITEKLIMLRGLEQVMMDMYDNPSLLHRLMRLLQDDTMNMLDTFERENILSLNTGVDDFVGSAGIGVTDELPSIGFTGNARLCDLWVLGESQGFVGVGPEQFYEFALQYQIPVLNRFGLICYGCCEPLDKKYDLLIKHLPKLRRVSVSPWADREIAAEKLGNKYIYSWKPNPAMICGPNVDNKAVEKHIRETLDITRGCCLEIIMKDTHTFQGDPQRIRWWSRMVSNLVRTIQ